MKSNRISLIIGNALEGDFYRINESLRDATKQLQFETTKSAEGAYNPWACSIPAFGAELVRDLLIQPQIIRGHLLIDQPYMNTLRSCLSKMIRRGPESKTERVAPSEQVQKAFFEPWLPASEVGEHAPSVVRAGRNLLVKAWPSAEKQYEELVEYIVPVRSSTPSRRRGLCTEYARGVIFREIPESVSAWEMGLDLANGLGHQALQVWKSVDPLFVTPQAAEIFSFRRGVLKPAILFFHEVVALAFTFRYVRGCISNQLLDGAVMAQYVFTP